MREITSRGKTLGGGKWLYDQVMPRGIDNKIIVNIYDDPELLQQ